ncbi:hemopexin repeat-containing protein [Cellulomonas sp. P5_C6]
MTKAYVFRGSQYVRFDVDAKAADAGYPRAIGAGWSGLTDVGFDTDLDTALDLGTGRVYLFKGDGYVRVDQVSNAVDGPVRSIGEQWPGLADAGFAESLDASVNWGNGKAYFFRGDSYLRYDIAADRADDGYPRSIADSWTGLADAGFADGLDAACVWNNGKVYFFRGDSYVRYDVAGDAVDAGYPQPIAGGWAGLGDAGFGDTVQALWIKLGATAGTTPSGKLGPGDHVWYWNGQVSTAQDIPRQAWFPGSASATDYQGHGEEIFNFVVHAGGEIRRGRPQMRSREGSQAWLNNNPGNLTGVAGGTDYGQYRDKFNWHQFLIFPTYQAGYDAIAAFLRGGGYRDLSITAAFQKYAPASDGNDPVSYASSVAAAAGVPTSTLVRDLTDAQMRFLQDRIVVLEGSVPGVVLAPDSADLPEAVRALLA